MKIKYLLFSVILFSSISCKKWLDVTASNQIKAEDQFKQTAGFKDALMGVYIGMTDHALYSKDMTWNLVDLLSRQYEILPTLALYSDVQLYKYKSVRSVDKLDAIWAHQYNVIANINEELDAMDKNKSVLTKIDYSIIKGELLGLRAFIHFDLIRLYGHSNYANRPELLNKLTVPYVTHLSKDLTPQLSYKETFALLEKDISNSLELLKEDPINKQVQRPDNYFLEANRDGFYNKREQRMNYYAVEALKARVLTWEGGVDNLKNAAVAAEDVISNSGARLITPTTTIGNDKILSVEQIFSLDVNAFANIVNPYLSADRTTDYDALIILPQTAETLYETGNADIGPVDIRFNTLLLSQIRGLVSAKLLQTQNNSYPNIMPLIKLPEMYYIAAEAYLNTDIHKSIDYLNKVRESRGIIEKILAESNLETVKSEIFKEYRKEYISEGQLFFFYKRTGTQHIPGLSSQIIADDAIYMIPYPDSEIEFGNRIQ